MSTGIKRILVIEDEPDVRESILDILSTEDFYVTSAENGQVGIQLAQEFQPDLIICDVMMPELDGYGVLTELQKNPKTATIPFIFLTALADKGNVRYGMDLGADDYLTKPFSYNEILQAIATRLDKQVAVEQYSEQKMMKLRQNISLSLPQELNASISGIVQISEMLMNEAGTATPVEICDMAEQINFRATNLLRLSQNCLLIYRLELIAMHPDQVMALRNDRLDDTLPIIEAIARAKAEQFQREGDLRLDLGIASAQISEQKLKKIVDELIDNAFKFSTKGTTVQVFSSYSNQSLVLHIVDQGHGMTAEQISNIGAYMQFDREILRQSGNGLGLIIAKRLVELHGGEFIIESIPERQTVIRVSLPA